MSEKAPVERFEIDLLEGLVLLHAITRSPDAENDADRSVDQLIREFSKYRAKVPKDLLESALYCCNMMDEEGKFWHPREDSFQIFVDRLLGSEYSFNRFYNWTIRRKDGTNKA